MNTYTIVETNENPLETIIEKSGLTVKFTVQQLKDHLEKTRKILRETKGQVFAHEKQDEMAIEILPLLKEIPEDKWNIVAQYATRQIQAPEIKSFVELSENTIKSYTEQLEIIEKEFGIVAYPVEEVTEKTNE